MIGYRKIREECVEYGYVEVGGVNVGGGHKRSKCCYSGRICRESLCPIKKELKGRNILFQVRLDLIKKYKLQDEYEAEMA
jgi:hypothetical protein